jgi:hypothetical protein
MIEPCYVAAILRQPSVGHADLSLFFFFFGDRRQSSSSSFSLSLFIFFNIFFYAFCILYV